MDSFIPVFCLFPRQRAALIFFCLRKARDGVVVFEHESQKFKAKKTWFVGYQYSPFFNAESASEAKLNTGWNEEWKIRNLACPRYAIVISGNSDAGIIPMIEHLGFFEGGFDGSNRYRIDPDVAVAVLTGKCSPEADTALLQRLRWKHSQYLAEKAALLRDVDPSKSEEARLFLEHEEGKINAKLERIQRRMDELGSIQ